MMDNQQQKIAKFDKGNFFEERVTQALITDHKFAEQFIEVIDLDFFNLEHAKETISIIIEYYKKYTAFPSLKLLATIISSDTKNQLVKDQCLVFLNKIVKQPLNGDLEYVKEASLDFCRKRSLMRAMSRVLDLAEQSNFDQISSIIQKSLQVGAEKNIGHVFKEQVESRFIESQRKPVSTGWFYIDEILNGGLGRGELGVVISPTGVGKSHFLVNIGAACALSGLNIVEYTFELSEMQVANRYDSYFSGVPINELKKNKEKVKASVDAVPGKIIIKSYPTKTASVTTIRNHLVKLATTKDFKPDIIVIDYADIMKSTKNYESKRFEHESIYEDIRALAMEYNVCIWTASQSNRASLDSEIVTLGGIAESYAKAMIADFVITMSRKLQDKLSNTGRFFIAKNRYGQDGLILPILINTETSKIEVMKSNSLQDSINEINSPTTEENLSERLAERYRNFQLQEQKV